jgi:hypothetical protein
VRRWRLILGGADADGTGISLSPHDEALDQALGMLYDREQYGQPSLRRSAGLGASRPTVVRWLGDIRRYFPSSVVRIMQQDALERIGLKAMLLEPEMLAAVDADITLVATLVELKSLIPDKTRETARQVVRNVVDEIKRKLESKMRQAVTGSLNRATRTRNPRYADIDWRRTIAANLRHYQAAYRTIVPDQMIGYGRKRSSLRDIVLCIDQSGSMATSVVYASIFGAILASLPAVSTRMIVFDTAVADLTALLSDPVDLLFGAQLGGGTDIGRAVAYCETLITRPAETVFVLVSDLCDGGKAGEALARIGALIRAGVQVISLLALSDKGAPAYDHDMAASIASMGAPVFACTPDCFPDLIAAAIQKNDVATWAAKNSVLLTRSAQ